MSNPTDLTPRFEVRKLGPEHLGWAKAVISHGNIFRSPVWQVAYPQYSTNRLYRVFESADYLVRHQIDSGLSYGVFDKEYEFKRAESVATQGALYWNAEKHPNATDQELLDQMDFPLVSVALALDAANPLDMAGLQPLFEALPHFPVFMQTIRAVDSRDPETWQPKGPGEVMLRNGTSTRADYEGIGVTKKMAHWLMREAAEMGFRGINIECFHDAVSHIWSAPPAPFRAELVGKIHVNEVKEPNAENVAFPEIKQALTQVYIHLQ